MYTNPKLSKFNFTSCTYNTQEVKKVNNRIRLSSNDEDKEFDFVIWSGLLPDLEQASSHKNEEQVKLFIINLPMYV